MRMLVFLACFTILAAYSGDGAAEQTGVLTEQMEKIHQLQEGGFLTEAERLARRMLDGNGDSLAGPEKRMLEYEIERSRRIQKDYRITEDELFGYLDESINDLTREEFEGWQKEGRFDFKVIDGEKLFVGPSRSNLFWRYKNVRARRKSPPEEPDGPFLWNEYERTKEAFKTSAQTTFDPYHFRLCMTITVKPNKVLEGNIIRCWMPFPQQFQSQSGVVLLSSSPEVKWMNAPNYPMRSLYFEQPSKGAEPTVFEATYTLTTYPRYVPIDVDKVQPSTAENNPEHEYFTREQAPHVQFTPSILKLVNDIGGNEPNPYRRAKKYYDWISHNIQYSYAREYSTLHNISQYVCDNRYGDCGQIALLFMTLCRASGIPARWQSGWVIPPIDVNMHDWSEIYIHPYGWIPVDANHGVFCIQEFTTLTPDQREELKDFYFGGLDAYRLIANREHGYPHFPLKESFRSDTVDFQRGELESEGKNIYYGDFSYRLEVDYLDVEKDSSDSGDKGPTEPGKPR